MSKDDLYWMREAIAEAERALDNGEIPVASILVAGNVEIGRSQTMVSRKGTMAAHGELFVILDAGPKLWSAAHPLVIYTNLEPCLMCLGAAMQVGIDEIVYGMKASPDGADRYKEDIDTRGQKAPIVRGGLLENETVLLMRRLLVDNPNHLAAPYVRLMLNSYD